MVRRVLRFLGSEVSGLHEAAYLLGFFALLSQCLALIRDRFFAATFGAGETLDVYYAAFRIPDIILISAASVVSVSILIPFLVEKIERSPADGKRFVDEVFTVFFAGIACVSLLAFFLAPILDPILFPGIRGAGAHTLVLLTRIMLLQPILLGVSNLFGTVTQVFRRFFVYAISPLLYNIGIIIGTVFLYPRLGAAGLAWGVVFGALLHLLIQAPVVFERGFFPRFVRTIDWREMKRVVLISLPRTLALSASSLAVLFLLSLASLLPEGSIAVFNFAWNLQSVPLSIIGASYSLAAFPTLVRLLGNGGRSAFLLEVSSALRHIVFWSFPALVLFIVLRAQIVRTVLGAGAFSWADTRLTAAALALFAVSIVAQGVTLLLIRGYYASGNTRIPLRINLASAVATVLLGIGFSTLFSQIPFFRYFIEVLFKVEDVSGTAILMLPLAYSVASIANALFLWRSFTRQFGRPAGVGTTTLQSFAASVIAGFAAYGGLNIFDDVFNLNTVVGIFLQGFLSGVLGIAAGVLALKILRSAELAEVWRTLHTKIWRAKVVAPDSAETLAS